MAVQQFILDSDAELSELCRRIGVSKLYVFGSAVRVDFKPESSDLDFIVEFADNSTDGYADQFFDLLDGLTALFNRPVDLLGKV